MHDKDISGKKKEKKNIQKVSFNIYCNTNETPVNIQPILIPKEAKTKAWLSAFSITIRMLKVYLSCYTELGNPLKNLWCKY